ncbi:MAG TPA: hypothetical protein DCE71_07715 [Parachlamydiales bacterium]|nr:hypothetical protein [Parachlamydiales bacterium]
MKADVIKFWMVDHGFDPKSTNFIAIDDDRSSSLKEFGDKFIYTYDLFGEIEFNESAQGNRMKILVDSV